MRNFVFLGTTIFMLAMTSHAQNQPAKTTNDTPLSNTLSEANNPPQNDDTDFAMYDNSGRYAMNNNEPDPLENNNDNSVLQEVEGEYYE